MKDFYKKHKKLTISLGVIGAGALLVNIPTLVFISTIIVIGYIMFQEIKYNINKKKGNI